MVSIAGGEPLLHPDIERMVAELIRRKVYVYLCTNAVLLRRRMERFTPSHYFSWVVHIDGLKERHDAAVDREGVFDEAVAAIREAKEQGFRVTTNSTFFNTDSPKTVRDVLDFLNDDLKVDAMMISPAYAYEKAPDQEHFLGVEQTRKLFARRSTGSARSGGSTTRRSSSTSWRASGVRVHGLGDPQLLRAGLAAALLPDGRRLRPSYKELVETTDWDAYGRGKDPRCANCMAHCGYEPTAVIATMGSLREVAARPGQHPLIPVSIITIAESAPPVVDGRGAARRWARPARPGASLRAMDVARARAVGRRDPAVPRRLGGGDRRAPRVQPRHRRAHLGSAPRCSTRPVTHRVGHRSPGLRAQAGDRSGRRLRPAPPAPAGCRATPTGSSPTTTWSRTATPRPRCPTPTAWPGPANCAATTARWSPWWATVP